MVLANQTVFENYDSFRNSKEYLSEFVITDEKNIKWTNFFSNKSFKEIELFLQTMPINTSDKLIQEIIFEILVSKKTFDRNLINDDDDKLLFEIFINKLFDTGRLNEIELVYSQTSELESNEYELLHPDNTVVCQVRTSRASMALPEDEEGVEIEEGVEGAEGAEDAEGKATESADGKSEAPKEESQDSKE